MNKEMMSGMMYGLVTVVVIILAASFVISMLLRFTELAETSFAMATLIISFIALFLGGLISGGKVDERGWMIGGATGLLYTILVFFVQYLGFDTGFTIQQYLFFALYILVSA
ncbi:MAG TPA: TIGR04086 family membrane protein, partial [Bacillales bacterium]